MGRCDEGRMRERSKNKGPNSKVRRTTRARRLSTGAGKRAWAWESHSRADDYRRDIPFRKLHTFCLCAAKRSDNSALGSPDNF